MTVIPINGVIQALRSASDALRATKTTAGVVAYPAKMVDSIMERVADEMASFFLSMSAAVVAKGRADVAEAEVNLQSDERFASILENDKKSLARALKSRAFYLSLGVKPNKVSKRAWTVPVDWSDMPDSYPRDVLDTHEKINVNLFMAKKSRAAGRWTDHKQTLDLFPSWGPGLLSVTLPSEDEFRDLLKKVRTTVEHEMQHSVQYIMQKGLQKRGKPHAAERAGTAFSPRQKIPTRGADPDADAYPRANKADRYYLDPVEFYPQIGTAVGMFLREYAKVDDGIAARWKTFVGLGSTKPSTRASGRKMSKRDEQWAKMFRSKSAESEVVASPFFVALKKHDNRLWKKAVSEGWRLLQKKS